MKRDSRSLLVPKVRAPDEQTRPTLKQRWIDFWFTPCDPIGMHAVRFLTGLLLLLWLGTLAGHRYAFFSLNGWFDVQAYQEAMRLPNGPPVPLGWSLLYLAGESSAWVDAIYWTSILLIVAFTLGVAARITAVATWAIVVSFIANPAISYGGDFLLVLPAFYLMVGYLLYRQWNGRLSTAERLIGTKDTWLWQGWRRKADESEANEPPQSHAANLAIRLFQVHFAIVVVTTGLHKLQSGDWWAGVAMWYPVHPPFQTTFESIKTNPYQAQFYLFVMSLAQYLMLAWQLAFPLFAWKRRWRVVLLGGGLIGWIGSIVVFGLPLFGPLFALGTLCYLTPGEWRGAISRLRERITPSVRIQSASTGPVRKSAKVGT